VRLGRVPVWVRAALVTAAGGLALATAGTGTAAWTASTSNPSNQVTMNSGTAGALSWAGSAAAGQSTTVDVSRWSPARETTTGSTWAQVATGERHTCAVTTGGTLFCWGGNSFGQLGLGDTNDRSTPTQVGSGTNWASVQTGRFHTCALTTGGALSCWGGNSDGQLGNNTTSAGATSSLQPIADPNAGTWTKISLGMSSTCGINSVSRLYCWGLNANGQLGVGSLLDKSVPTQNSLLVTTWTAVSVGAKHTCGLQGASLFCWGLGQMYALGTGTTAQKTASGSALAGTWNAVAAGRDTTCAIKSDKSLWCVGVGYYGQTGNGSPADAMTFTQVGTSTAWTSVSVGRMSVCALAVSALSCWGGGASGELGLGQAEM
jgi:alpha-tubulin suppressor-like RCC1 family protein